MQWSPENLHMQTHRILGRGSQSQAMQGFSAFKVGMLTLFDTSDRFL